jgi:hypothetical protein
VASTVRFLPAGSSLLPLRTPAFVPACASADPARNRSPIVYGQSPTTLRATRAACLELPSLTLASPSPHPSPHTPHPTGFYSPGEKTGGETHGVGWGARNFHGGNGRGPAKRAGENTDYGDYNILILEHLARFNNEKAAAGEKASPIMLAELVPQWQERLQTWRAWM